MNPEFSEILAHALPFWIESVLIAAPIPFAIINLYLVGAVEGLLYSPESRLQNHVVFAVTAAFVLTLMLAVNYGYFLTKALVYGLLLIDHYPTTVEMPIVILGCLACYVSGTAFGTGLQSAQIEKAERERQRKIRQHYK